ncbi:carbohydrate porin [Methylosinus sp. Sm6]|nr:carbohydrate porin [Methylosinus sp. Sm6]
MSTSFPAPSNTIDPDVGGLRSALAEMGIGYIGWNQNSFTNNIYPNAARSNNGKQQYNGQKPTFSSINYLMVVYDLSRFGIPDGQFIAGTEHQYYGWANAGPSRWGINTLAYYQTLFDKTIEIKLGYLKNSYEFAGLQIGANQALNLFGASSNMLYQAGLNTNSTPTPGIDIKLNIPGGFYSKLAIQQPISPDGVYATILENPTGLHWRTNYTGIFIMDEIGYNKSAAPNSPRTWIRAGAGYNSSKFKSDITPGTRVTGNSVFYFVADRQLWQIDPAPGGVSKRGVYAGFTAIYAPPDRNTISEYYEARVYAMGLFDSRPDDTISLVGTNTVFSHYLVDTAILKKQLAHRDSKSVTASYSAHIDKGLYFSLGLGYINNPTSVTYTPQTGHALNVFASTLVFF